MSGYYCANRWQSPIATVLLTNCLIALEGCAPSSVPAECVVAADSMNGKVIGAAVPTVAADAMPMADDDIPIGNPTAVAHVIAAANVFPRRAPPGGQLVLAIRIRIAFGWHIFAVDHKSDSSVYSVYA